MKRDSHRARGLLLRLYCLILLVVAVSICAILYSRSDETVEQTSQCGNLKEQNTNPESDQIKQSKCETVHLAFVCGGHNATRDFYTLLKSILFYRNNITLRLHLFVDSVSKKIIKELFRTWIVPDLSVNYYHVYDYEPDISWIPNQHYSRRYGLLKLVVPEVLARAGLNQVIFLDTDMLAHGDIYELWNQFTRFQNLPEAFIGLVENHSDWYLRGPAYSVPGLTRDLSWPALGRGFNTGLMLFKLDRLRNHNWSTMWRDLAETELIAHLATSLADQDIYNAIIKKNSWIVLELDCRYNLQLNDHTLLNSTCPNHRSNGSLKMTHWNSPYKLSTRNPQAEYYKSWYATFLSWNAKLLERAGCANSQLENDVVPTGQSPLDDACRDMRPRPHERLRTFLYFLDFEIGRGSIVTIVVHLSIDRFEALDELAAHWPGPMSVALYLGETEIDRFVEMQRSSEFLSRRKDIGYHLVFRDVGSNYPINRLRNIALNNAVTPFVFMTDIDFLPVPTLYGYLSSVLTNIIAKDKTDALRKRALVIPAFENNEYKFEFPNSKTELIRQLDLGTVTKFRDNIWSEGQAATDYERWKMATQPYEVDWRPEYEPFIVASANVTRYDERFNGFGWNKVEHIMQLAALGYEFSVLPEAYTIHRSHPASYDIRKYRDSRKYQACIRLLKQTFLTELRHSYPSFVDNMTQTQRVKQAMIMNYESRTDRNVSSYFNISVPTGVVLYKRHTRHITHTAKSERET